MPSLRDLVEARRIGTTLTPVDADTFRMALRRTYDAIAADVWKGKTPEEDEYVAVLCDRLVAHGRLTEDEYRKFCMLRREIREQLALEVGP